MGMTYLGQPNHIYHDYFREDDLKITFQNEKHINLLTKFEINYRSFLVKVMILGKLSESNAQ